jgi:hypothetical protein
VRTPTLPPEVIKIIQEVLRGASAWAEAKAIGKPFIKKGPVREAYERLASSLRAVGIFLVEVGELESFCPTIQEHGPAWVIKVFQRDLAADEELEHARRFAETLAQSLP